MRRRTGNGRGCMKVTITGFAKRQIRETARYIQIEFGRKYRDIFLHKVQDVQQYLAENAPACVLSGFQPFLPYTYGVIL